MFVGRKGKAQQAKTIQVDEALDTDRKAYHPGQWSRAIELLAMPENIFIQAQSQAPYQRRLVLGNELSTTMATTSEQLSYPDCST